MDRKTIPERMCIACRKRSVKDDFVRIVKTDGGMLVIDESKKINARGAYICKDEACIVLAQKKNSLARTFKMGIDDTIYEQIRNSIKQG